MKIHVSTIDPNPHRNFKRNPINKEQVDKIVESIGRTGFWDNVVVRTHPEKPDRYQLAYGHNRIDAVRRLKIETIELPVRPLSDWDMLCAMIDENETQQKISPQIAFENILATVEELDRVLTSIGPNGTEEQFYRAMGKSPVTRVTGLQSHFVAVRNAFFAGDGLGKDFVMSWCPSAKIRPNAVSQVLSSHFGAQRQEAKNKQAEKEEEQARQKDEEATQEEDKEEAERLRQEADESREKARKKREEAKKIGEGTIDPEILQLFDTVYQMERFAAAVKSIGIPKKAHRQAANHVIDEDLAGSKAAGRKIEEKLDAWYYKFSGQEERDRQRQQKEAAFKAFRRHVKDGNFESYLRDLLSTGRKLVRDMSIAIPTAPYFENQRLRDSACKDLKELIEAAGRLFDGLSGEPVIDEPVITEINNGQHKQLTSS